jgi:ATP-binding cassette subfamily G (WHITE) protein 2 (PDR)
MTNTNVRLKADPSVTLVAAFFNSIMALVISSVFYNLQPTTDSFFQRGALLIFAILLNAFASALEVRKHEFVELFSANTDN